MSPVPIVYAFSYYSQSNVFILYHPNSIACFNARMQSRTVNSNVFTDIDSSPASTNGMRIPLQLLNGWKDSSAVRPMQITWQAHIKKHAFACLWKCVEQWWTICLCSLNKLLSSMQYRWTWAMFKGPKSLLQPAYCKVQSMFKTAISETLGVNLFEYQQRRSIKFFKCALITWYNLDG